jgi:predicted RNA-binding Zn ribbon-like protein
VVFAHDTEAALQAAVELVNTLGEPDPTIADLAEFYLRWGYTGRHDGTEGELADVLALRTRLRALFLAPRDDAAVEVNELLAEGHAVPRLVRHDPLDWHVHAEPLDAPLAAQIAVETAMGMVEVIRADENGRFSVCADDTCDGIVLDLSRNRSRRFCSAACGNRNAVAAYRARQASH